VLFVRRLGQERDRAVPQLRDELSLVLAESLDAAAVLLLEATPVQYSDAGADEPVRKDAPVGKRYEDAHGGGAVSCQRLRIFSMR